MVALKWSSITPGGIRGSDLSSAAFSILSKSPYKLKLSKYVIYYVCVSPTAADMSRGSTIPPIISTFLSAFVLEVLAVALQT